MIPRALLAAVGRRATASAVAAPAGTGAIRCAATFLNGRPPAIDPNAGTFAAFYAKNIREFDTPTKDHMVAVGQDEKFTVGAFDRQVYAYAHGLIEALGLKKGEKVVAWMTNELEHLVLQYAAALVGVTVVEVDPKLGFDAVLSVIKAEEARALFFSRRFGSEDRFAKAGEVFEKELESHVLLGGYAPIESKRLRSLKHVVCVTGETDDGIVRFRDIPVYGNDGDYAGGDDVAAAQAYLSKTDAVLVPYTAGAGAGAAAAEPVRGKPLSHADTLAAAAAAAKALSLKSTDVVVLTAPLHNPLALVGGALAPASVTAKTVLPNKTFDAAKTLAAATVQRATVLVTLPEHVAPLNAELSADAAKPAAKRAYNLSTLRAGVVLGAPAGAAPLSLGSTQLKAVDAGKGFA